MEGRDFAGEADRGDAAAPSGDYQCGDAEGGVAGRSGGVAVWRALRYYTLLGLRCETTSGLKRKLLVLSERIACRCAHRVICVSECLRQKAIELGIVDAERTVVFASGSFVGTDAKRFTPTADALQRAGKSARHWESRPKRRSWASSAG